MKKIIGAILLLSTFSIYAVNVKTVAYLECDKLIQKLDFRDKPNHCHSGIRDMTGVISLMFVDNNIISLNEESLKLTSLAYNGKDFRKSLFGVQNYKLGSFPNIAKNNQFAIFDIHVEVPEFSSIQAVSGEGEINYYSATQKQTVSKTIDITQPYSFKAGSNILSNMKKEQIDENGGLKEAFQKGFQELLMGNTENTFTVKGLGNTKEIASVTVYENGIELEGRGISWVNGRATYNFTKPESNKVRIDVVYWEGFTERTAKISF